MASRRHRFWRVATVQNMLVAHCSAWSYLGSQGTSFADMHLIPRSCMSTASHMAN